MTMGLTTSTLSSVLITLSSLVQVQMLSRSLTIQHFHPKSGLDKASLNIADHARCWMEIVDADQIVSSFSRLSHVG